MRATSQLGKATLVLLVAHFVCAVNYASAQTSGSERKPLESYIWSHVNYEPGPKGKPVVDFNAIDNWASLAPFALSVSSDGKFFAYVINRGVGFFFMKPDSLVVQSVTGSWRRSFAKLRQGFFSGDGTQYIVENNGSLCFLRLGGDESCVADVTSHVKPAGDKIDWLIYRTKADTAGVTLRNLVRNDETRFDAVSAHAFDPNGAWLALQRSGEAAELLLYNLRTGKERRYPGVTQYLFGGNGDALLLTTKSGTTTSLRYATLSDATEPRTIWTGNDTSLEVKSPSLDGSGKQVVFTLQNGTSGDLSVWYYKAGRDAAVEMINQKTAAVDSDLVMLDGAKFTADGRYIQFSLLDRPDQRQPDPTAVGVTIWSYRDTLLQSAQAEHIPLKPYLAYFSLDTKKAIRVLRKHEKQVATSGDYAVVATDRESRIGDRFWEKVDATDSTWLVSLRDGSRKLLPRGASGEGWGTMGFSPSGKYLVYFDATNGGYGSYDLTTGSTKELSRGTGASFGRKSRGDQFYYYGGLGWLRGTDELIVFDGFDVWKLDGSGRKRPESLTNGYGARHNTVLGVMNERRDYVLDWGRIVEPGPFILTAFDSTTKNTGFFRTAGPGRDPELLSMGPYLIQDVGDPNFSDNGMKPVKARNADTWVLKRQSSKEEPNYFVTHDFKSFRQLTHIEQHSKYNWYTTELHTFKKLDGTTMQGLLYKPENFDPSRKYPVLVVFYGRFSEMLHRFNAPSYAVDGVHHALHPGWFVSHGYIVFTPDIEVGPGHGATAFNILEGLAQYLGELPYVDSKRIGASAHSWSGKLGMYLLTHSKRYAAIAISEGFLYGNLINVALSLEDNSGTSRLEAVEEDFEFGNLWQNKERWLDHASVLNVDRVSTPLLLFNNKYEKPMLQRLREEYPNQTTQIFTAMRRMDKPVWWLQYDKGGHNLYDVDEARDFTVRYMQFFDHFLKGAPAPQWMTRGLPYKLNKIEHRLELER